jgi:hypothetical protein
MTRLRCKIRKANYIKNEPPETKLIKASFESNITTIKEMLEKGSVDINGNSSPNALGWALLNANQPITSYLISKGADPNHPNVLHRNIVDSVDGLGLPGSFQFIIKHTENNLENENPQLCLEMYSQEASLDIPTLDRLIKLGADIHCCNDLALHLCIATHPAGDKDPEKIARSISALRDRGASMTSIDIYNSDTTVFDKALKQGLTNCCKEILKGLSEQELCKIIRTHKETPAIKMAEKEISSRLKNFQDDILTRYLERASAKLPEFLKIAEREIAHRKAEKNVKAIKKKFRNNTLEI